MEFSHHYNRILENHDGGASPLERAECRYNSREKDTWRVIHRGESTSAQNAATEAEDFKSDGRGTTRKFKSS